MIRHLLILFVAAGGSLSLAACSGNSRSTEQNSGDIVDGPGALAESTPAESGEPAAVIRYAFDAASGAFPSGTKFEFSDYPVREDAASQSDERSAALSAIESRLRTKLGRSPLLTEWVAHESAALSPLGYWLNARFEQTEATEAAPAFVMTHMNRSDDMDTNILFSLDAAAGLAPDTEYKVDATLVLRSNAPKGCSGVGGPPDSVTYALIECAHGLRWPDAGFRPRTLMDGRASPSTFVLVVATNGTS